MIANRCSHCTDAHHHHHHNNNTKHDHLQQPQPPSAASFAAMSRRNPTTKTIPNTSSNEQQQQQQTNQPFSWLYGSVRLNWSRTPSGRRWSETDDSCQHITPSTPEATETAQHESSVCYEFTSLHQDNNNSNNVQHPHLMGTTSNHHCCGVNGPSESPHNDQIDVTASAANPASKSNVNNDDNDLRSPSNPLTELKRSRTTRDSVRRSSHRSVWWASGLAHLLLVLIVIVVGGRGLWPIRGVEAGMESLDRHLRDLAGKVPQNILPNEDGSE